MQFSIVSTSDALLALEDRWNDLIARSPDSSVFQSFSWLTIWWRFFSEDRELRVILAEKDGKLLGLLPVYIERTPLLPIIGLRKLRLVGYGGDTTPDDLGPILDGNHHEEAMAALMAGLESLRPEWDIAEFEDLDPESPLIDAMDGRRPSEVEVREGAEISYVELPRSFDEYLAKLSSNRRSKIRRGRKKLSESTNYRFHVVRSGEELDRYYPDLVRLHLDRWEPRADHIGFSTEGYVNFHRNVMADLMKQNCIRLMLLISGEEAIAANYCYCWRGGFYFFQGGFAKTYEPFRIGEVLMGHAIEQAIDEGMQVFDMLRGEHDYKKSLTDKVRNRTHLYVNQPTLRARSYRALRAGYRTVRDLRGRGSEHGHGTAPKPKSAVQGHAA